MPRSVYRWLRRNAEPYLGEAIIRGAEFLRKLGLPEKFVEKVTDGTLQVAPKFLDKLESLVRDKAGQYYESPHLKAYQPFTVDYSPASVNPTFDLAPTAPVVRNPASLTQQMINKVAYSRVKSAPSAKAMREYSQPAPKLKMSAREPAPKLSLRNVESMVPRQPGPMKVEAVPVIETVNVAPPAQPAAGRRRGRPKLAITKADLEAQRRLEEGPKKRGRPRKNAQVL